MKKQLNLSNACICGNGIVGRATAKLFGITAFYDILPSLSTVALKDLKQYEYIFVCLPTPTIEGKCQTKPISDLVETIEGGWYYTDKDLPTYIIRSTVPPGTADQLMQDLDMDRIISNPEFLSQDTAEQDITNPFAVVIGGKNQSSLGKVRNIYRQVYSEKTPLISTNNVTAEMIKYTLNCLFSSKVIFANAIYDIAERMGGDYNAIKATLDACPYAGANHWDVWYKGRRGVHGRCLPKDLEAFANWTLDDLFLFLLQASRRIDK